GMSVAKAATKYFISPEHILWIHDEFEKTLGKFSIKYDGSGSQYGVRSCVDCHNDMMPQLCVGIGRPLGKTPVDSYVLGRFSQEEQNVLDTASPAEGRRASRKNKARILSTPQDTTEEQKQS
uniref:Uncharacterized protein n=1 Tax=Cyprinus carpio TaxID=7962 RepID=A0A8C1XFS8_CYPCA